MEATAIVPLKLMSDLIVGYSCLPLKLISDQTSSLLSDPIIVLMETDSVIRYSFNGRQL